MNEAIVYIQDGQIKNPKVVRKFFEEMPDGKHLLSSKGISKRTLPQNAYLHWMFNLVKEGLQNIGYREVKTADQAKHVCKSLFLSYEVDNGTGGKIKLIKRTRDLSKDEMSQFIDETIQ